MPISRDGLNGYELGDRIGRGGFATVYRAMDLTHDREVAIKVLESSMEDADRRKFDRERRAIGRLANHPHVVPVLESGYTDEGEAYLVLEYAPGGSMADRITDGGPMPWVEAAQTIDRIADAVEQSHGHGILHCDIKPENILLSAYGAPKLTDFGIARRSATETASPQALSMAHAPPESLEGGMPTELVDVYSLASTFHHLVAGAPPFERGDDSTMAAYALRVATAPPPELTPFGVPPEVDRVIKWAMAKRAEDRPQSVAAFRRALRAAADGSPQAFPTATDHARQTVVDTSRTAVAEQSGPIPTSAGAAPLRTAPAPPGLESTEPTGTGRSKLPIVAGIGALAVAAALAIGGLVLVNGSGDGSASDSPDLGSVGTEVSSETTEPTAPASTVGADPEPESAASTGDDDTGSEDESGGPTSILGSGLTSGDASWWELVEGDCADIRFDVGTISTVPRRSCDEPHGSEITAVVDAPAAGGPFPGLFDLRGFANSVCQARFAGYVGADFVATELAASFVFPDEGQWNQGVEQVLCLARRWDEAPLRSSVFDAADETHVRVDVGDLMPLARLGAGTCVATPDGGGLAVPSSQGLRGQHVTVANCAAAHGGEVVGLGADFLIGPTSGDHDLDTLLTEARPFCNAELTRFAGEARAETVSAIVPDVEEWGNGGRDVICMVLWDPPNVGSLAP